MRAAKKLTASIATLALCAGVLFGAGSAVYASEVEGGAIVADSPGVEGGAIPAVDTTGAVIAELSVQNVWLAGDTLHIQVADTRTGVNQTLELNLRDYAGVSDEFVSIQAADRDGNKSNTIQFKNPYYAATPPIENGELRVENGAEPPNSQLTILNSQLKEKPFTPDGTGSVVDNVTDGDGKEFFSIKTEDGNVFYLIVDRQRTADNVYLLNAVTENDLASLAKSGDGMGGGIPTANPANAGEQPNGGTNGANSANGAEPSPEPTDPPAKSNSGGINGGALIFIVIAALAVGVAGYYIKILKPKRAAADSEDYDEADDEAEFDDDDGDSDEDGDDDGDEDADEDEDDADTEDDEDRTGGDSE